MHHVVIFNPAAGKGGAAKQEPLIRRMLDQQRIPYTFERTEGPMHAASLAREAAESGAEVVVAAGGDGTCNELINGLMKATVPDGKPAVGVISLGRGNDFASLVGVRDGAEAGVRALAAGRRRWIDVGRLTGCGEYNPRYFCNGLGIGFDTRVGLEAAKMKHIGSFLGYVFGALKTVLIFPEAPTVRLRYDGVELHQQAAQISLMNGKRMGGAFYMCPRATSDDGQIDLCIAGRVGRAQMVRLFFHFLKGTQERSRAIGMDHSQRFELAVEEGMLAVHADGETICLDGARLVAECVPGAVEVVTGEGAP